MARGYEFGVGGMGLERCLVGKQQLDEARLAHDPGVRACVAHQLAERALAV